MALKNFTCTAKSAFALLISVQLFSPTSNYFMLLIVLNIKNDKYLMKIHNPSYSSSVKLERR